MRSPDASCESTVRGSRMSSVDGTEWHARKIRDWALAIIRFAATNDAADRQMVRVLAEEMDGLGSLPGVSSFTFFRRISNQRCAALVDGEDPNRTAILRHHLRAIDDRHLRQLTAAAFDLERACPTRIVTKAAAAVGRRCSPQRIGCCRP